MDDPSIPLLPVATDPNELYNSSEIPSDDELDRAVQQLFDSFALEKTNR